MYHIIIGIITFFIVIWIIKRIWRYFQTHKNRQYNVFKDAEFSIKQKHQIVKYKGDHGIGYGKSVHVNNPKKVGDSILFEFIQQSPEFRAGWLKDDIPPIAKYKYFEFELKNNFDGSKILIGLMKYGDMNNSEPPNQEDTTCVLDGQTGELKVGSKSQFLNIEFRNFGDCIGFLMFCDDSNDANKVHVYVTYNGVFAKDMTKKEKKVRADLLSPKRNNTLGSEGNSTFRMKNGITQGQGSSTKPAKKKTQTSPTKNSKKTTTEKGEDIKSPRKDTKKDDTDTEAPPVKNEVFDLTKNQTSFTMDRWESFRPYVGCDGPCQVRLNIGTKIFRASYDEFAKGIFA